jgi:response regulator RpfG family c-di-GMP phosphodiesterase
MKAHDPIGVEILTAAISSESLREMIRTHNAWFGGNPQPPELPVGKAVPVGARILAVADAYDAMATDRFDHKALPH